MIRFIECLKLFIGMFFTFGVIFLATVQFMAGGANFLVAFVLALVLDAIILPVVAAVLAKMP